MVVPLGDRGTVGTIALTRRERVHFGIVAGSRLLICSVFCVVLCHEHFLAVLFVCDLRQLVLRVLGWL